MLALAEPDSAFVPQPGTLVTGEEYKAALSGFLAMASRSALLVRHSHVGGD